MLSLLNAKSVSRYRKASLRTGWMGATPEALAEHLSLCGTTARHLLAATAMPAGAAPAQ